MMKHFATTFFLLLSLSACNDQREAVHTVKAIINETTSLVKQATDPDNDSVKIVGDLILSGKSIWNDNEKYLKPLMDSLATSDYAKSEYYFKVFGKICEQADGYVGEELGTYILDYFQKDPQKFLRHSALVSNDIVGKMGYEAGVEMAMREEHPEQAFQQLIKTTKEHLPNLTEDQKEKLNEFFRKMKEGIKAGA
ncbi:MAG: hypothetical protein Q8909_15340 [Bacteroidota bacterium]|nr:hypothetical protein [Bacteroidota bacterium]